MSLCANDLIWQSRGETTSLKPLAQGTMMTQKVYKFSYEELYDLMQLLVKKNAFRLELLAEKHCIVALDESDQKLFTLRLALPMPSLEDFDRLDSYLASFEPELPNYVIALIQLGASSLAMVEGEDILSHKSIKKYMKRHKRGKAQIAYLNAKGKSKAGSRIRLANTERFFEEINERLTEWEESFEIDRILYSCTATTWGLLFSSRVPPPFEKKDPRLVKIPLDVNIPTFEELQKVQAQVIEGQLLIHQEERIEELVSSLDLE